MAGRGAQRCFAFPPPRRAERVAQVPTDLVREGRLGEHGHQPLAVRGPATFEEKADPDEVAGHARGEHARAEVAAAAAGAADERFFLADPQPAGRQDIAPDVVGVPGQCPKPRGEQIERVVQDHAAREAGHDLGRGQQPVRQIHPAGGVDTEPVEEERLRGGHLHLVVWSAVVSVAVGVDDREIVESSWQPLQGDVDRRGIEIRGDEQLQAGAEIVVRGDSVPGHAVRRQGRR